MASSCEHLERLSAEGFPPQKTPGACEECLTEGTVWVSGAVAAAIALATIVGNAVVDWFSQFCGRRTTLLLWASGVQTAAAVGVGVAGSFWLAVSFSCLLLQRWE